MKDSAISVLIPTRHRPVLLQRALASVAAQTRRPDEVLVIDDGDEPLELLSRGEVSVVRQEAPHGAPRARNRGASLVRGRFIAFLDDDDTWHPDYLAEAERIALTGDLDLVLTAFLKVKEGASVGEQEIVPEKVPPEFLRPEDFLVRNPGIRGSNLFISRSTFMRAGGFDQTLPSFHDMDLGYRLACLPGLRYGRNVQPRVHFHVHTGLRLSTAGSPTNIEGLRAFLAKHSKNMHPEQVAAFKARARQLFGVEP
ncbi:glycosyltransferase family 2 protein [Hyalangium gracile]|uniref:glycosyltransferase family 2 protein n=1 Tax=Hyalangium gracile TaxID=394092 RepID=UPI001CCFA385|nr:glycosyltransferase family A protein [Hyalangium gracile]